MMNDPVLTVAVAIVLAVAFLYVLFRFFVLRFLELLVVAVEGKDVSRGMTHKGSVVYIYRVKGPTRVFMVIAWAARVLLWGAVLLVLATAFINVVSGG